MIGIINFAHSDPLYLAMEDKKRVIRGTPKEILNTLFKKEIHLGMISLISYLENKESLNLEESANIHSSKTTMSTLLISRGKGIFDGMRIAVTSHTRTTEFYLELILRKMGIRYEIVHTDKTSAEELLRIAEYALVIGDEALMVYNTQHRILMDVGYEFSRLFSMIPVYAVTVSLKGMNVKNDLDELNKAVEASSGYKDEASAINSKKFGLSKDVLLKYYSLISYSFDNQVRKTIEFIEEILRYGGRQ